MWIVLLILLILCLFFLWSMLSGGPYTPIPGDHLRQIWPKIQLAKGAKLVDLGSGDGRVLFSAACDPQLRAEGFEINPVLVLFCWLRALLTRTPVHVRWESLFNADLSRYDIVFVHLLPHGLKRLQAQILRQARPGTQVISYGVPLEQLSHEQVHELSSRQATTRIFPDRFYTYVID